MIFLSNWILHIIEFSQLMQIVVVLNQSGIRMKKKTQDADEIKTFQDYVKYGGVLFETDFESAFPKWLKILHDIHSNTKPARSDKKPKYR